MFIALLMQTQSIDKKKSYKRVESVQLQNRRKSMFL